MAGLKKQLFSSKQPKAEPSEHHSRSLFHTSMPDSFKSQLEGVQHYSTTYLDALDLLCNSAAKLSDTFVAVFRDTPFWEASVQLQQISQDISSATKCVSSQVRDDAVALVTSLAENDGESPERNDENLQVLAKCFLCMLQTQIQFFSTAMEMMAPLSKYNDIIDIIQEYEDNPTMKDVCHSWLAASQNTSILRRGVRVSSDEVQLLVVNQDNTDPEPKVVEVKMKYDACVQRYKYELSGIPIQEQTLIGGFMLYPQCLALVLKGCCNDNEIEAAGSQSKPLTKQVLHKLYKSQSNELSLDEWKSLVQKEIWNTAVQCEGTLLRASTSKDKETENFTYKLDGICRFVRNISNQLGLDLAVEDIALCVLSEMCPSVSHRASQIAVQIVYANTNLVSVESAPLVGDLQRYAQLSVNGSVIVLEVPTLWWLVEELHVESHDIKEKLASVEVVYTAKIDLIAWSEGRMQDLPTISVKLCKNTNEPSFKPFERAVKPLPLPKSIMGIHSSQAAGQPQDSPESPTSGLRKTFTKLTSKFSRKTTPTSSPTRKGAFCGESSQQSGCSRTTNQDKDTDPSSQSDCCLDGKVTEQNSKNLGSSAWTNKPDTVQTEMSPGNPTVTITTTDSGPDEENLQESNTNAKPGVIGNSYPASKHLFKPWKASEEQVQDVIDLLSGPARPNKQNTNMGGAGSWHTVDNTRYDNFNPCFVESETVDRNTGSSSASSATWSTSTDSTGTRGSGMMSYQGYDPEFAKYLETNIPGRRGRGHVSHYSNMSQVGGGQSWGMPDSRLNRSWPAQEANPNENLNWSAVGGTSGGGGGSGGQDSGSSSDDSSSNNGENVFSMGLGLAGPDLVAAINRRRHSSGGEHEKEDDHIKFLDVMMESKTTKTWPPKLLWQRGPPSKVPPFPMSNPNLDMVSHDHLGIHPSLAAHWGDPMSHGTPVWSNQTTSAHISNNTPPSPLIYRHNTPSNQPSTGHQKLDRRFAINVHNYQS